MRPRWHKGSHALALRLRQAVVLGGRDMPEPSRPAGRNDRTGGVKLDSLCAAVNRGIEAGRGASGRRSPLRVALS